MKSTAAFLLVLGVAVGSIRADCWTTGCQPNHWKDKGCAQYDREERGREPCRDNQGAEGNKYTCCKGQSQNPGSPGQGPTNPGSGFITYDQFRRAVTSNGYPDPSHDQYNNFNGQAKSGGRISSLQECGMALAQFLHESDGLRAKREYACENTNCPNSYRTPDCDAPGQYYYGRGYIQLTWCGNYRAASYDLFGDDRLVRDPDMVARDDSIAWRTTFWYWSKRVHDAHGVQQGQFGASTKAINGGIECSSPGHHQAQKRFNIYGKVRSAFDLPGAGDPSGCA